MTPLRRRMLEDMQVRQLSSSTQRMYVSAVARFARHFGRAPARLGPEQVRAYQLHLTNERRLARLSPRSPHRTRPSSTVCSSGPSPTRCARSLPTRATSVPSSASSRSSILAPDAHASSPSALRHSLLASHSFPARASRQSRSRSATSCTATAFDAGSIPLRN